MQSVKLIFGKSNTIGSWLIRLSTFSRWSHVGIVTADGNNVIEARAFHGVVVTPIDEFKKRYTSWEIANAPVVDIDQCHTLCRQQIGKKYDWSAIFGFIFRKRIDDTDKWICSELYAYCSGVVRNDRLARFTPEDCWKISK